MEAAGRSQNWKMGEYVVDLAHQEVFDLWCSIGIWAGLTTDAQIATFLIQQFERTRCGHCKMPLAMYCMHCNNTSQQKSALGQPNQTVDLTQSSTQPELTEQSQPSSQLASEQSRAEGTDSKVNLMSDLSSIAATALSEMSAIEREDGLGQIQGLSIEVREKAFGHDGSLATTIKCEEGASSVMDQTPVLHPSSEDIGSLYSDPVSSVTTDHINSVGTEVNSAGDQAYSEKNNSTYAVSLHPRAAGSSSGLPKNSTGDKTFYKGTGNIGTEQNNANDKTQHGESVSNFVAANLPSMEQLSRAVAIVFGEQSRQNDQTPKSSKREPQSVSTRSMRLSSSLLRKASKRKTKMSRVVSDSLSRSRVAAEGFTKSGTPQQKRGRKSRAQKAKDVLDDPEQRFSCSICETSYDNMCVYRKHMKTHGITKPFACPKCEDNFASLGHIKRHTCLKKADTPQKEDKPFVCNQCGSAYSLKCNLKRHLLIHTGGRRQFICEVCSATFYEKQSLILHSKTHNSERPYQCSVCGATFRLPSCLNKHAKRHKEEKPYVCTECGFAFRAKDYLRQHMRTHTGERPFVCEVCGAGFAQKGSLNSHKKTHKTDM